MKKTLLTLGTAGMVLAVLPLFAAFEAHVVNVTATIENALSVPLEVRGLSFGTTFPQEALNQTLDVTLSQSFGAQQRVNVVDYTIRQKPKCGIPVPNTNPVQYSGFAPATEDANGNFVCPTVPGITGASVQTVQLPLLCPYLSKHETTGDGTVENDSAGINSFHGLPGPWTVTTTLATAVNGQLNQIASDTLDVWNIDLHVPCFKGSCAQDWAAFVHAQSPNANPDDYMADPGQEHQMYGCDLWLETTGISSTST
jgi:hypothetical protein